LVAIGAGLAEVDHPAPPHVIDRAERFRRRLQHHRPLGQADDGEEIDRVRVGGQEEGLGIHQGRKDHDFIVLHPDAQRALVGGGHVHALERVHERFEGMGEVQMVVNLLHRLRGGHAVLELEHANGRLDFVRRGDRCGRLRERGQCRTEGHRQSEKATGSDTFHQ